MDIQKKKLLLDLKGKENITLDGTKINIYANIGGVDDVKSVLENDAGGIGLHGRSSDEQTDECLCPLWTVYGDLSEWI